MYVPTTRIAPAIRRAALTGASAVALSGLGATAAQAGQSQEIATEGGSVVFLDRGERVRAHDERRDGYGVGAFVLWTDDEGNFHKVKVIDGRSSGGPARRNLSIPEHTRVGLSMCYTRNGYAVPGKCSDEQQAVA
jgi:hypothetical protein